MTTTATSKNEYLEARRHRIARNEKRIRELGLLNSTLVTKKPKKKKVRRKIQFEQSTRRSTRGKNAKILLQMLSYQHDSDTISIKQEEKELQQTPPPFPIAKRRHRVHITTQVKPLTTAQRETIQKMVGDNFLNPIEQYLLDHDKISEQNLRSVMRQLKKLANGEGIRYESPRYGWPEGKYFRKGSKISPSDDIAALMTEAESCENKWGRDRGNGWLLSHPLKKLFNFQQFICEKHWDLSTC